MDIRIDSNDNIYAQHSGTIHKYNNGIWNHVAYVAIFSPFTLDSSGYLYFGDGGVVKVNLATGTQTVIDSYPGVPLIKDIATDGNGNVYAAYLDYGIRKVASNGSITFVEFGNFYESVLLDKNGNLYYTELDTYSGFPILMKKDINGVNNFIAKLDFYPFEQNVEIRHMVMDNTGNIYIAIRRYIDHLIGSIWKLRPDKNYELILDNLNQPSGIAIDSKGNIFVADKYKIIKLQFSLDAGWFSTNI